MISTLSFDPATVEPEISSPPPEKVVAGTPVHTTWLLEEREAGRLFAGIWQSTPGAWRVSYDEWEYCHILEGVSRLTSDSGETKEVRAGDSFTIPPGFSGIWEVVETTRKDFVILLP